MFCDLLQPTKVQGMPVGSRGVLVSCVVGKERLAGQEAVAVLSEAYDSMTATKTQCSTEKEHATEEDGDSRQPADIGAALAAEVADLKDHSRQPFFYTTLGCPAIVYVECRYQEGPLPSQLVEWACSEAQRTKQNKTRLCHRFYPIDVTCPACTDTMQTIALKIASEHFPDDSGAEKITFSVDYEKRAHPSELSREVVIDMFAKAVKQPPHKVDLTDPQKTILVNVMKDSCGISVARNYRKLAKFNLTALATEDQEDVEKVKQTVVDEVKKNENTT